MAPRLDTIPLDILQHIAYLSALGSPANPPIDILHLLLTNSTIYRSLRLRSNPHLYANIFRSVFDPCRSLDHVTASNIAAEFICRHRFLRRVRRLDFSTEELIQDLWAGVRMILESNGANQTHLISVNFSSFLIDLSQLIFTNYPGTEGLDLKPVIVWLLCVSLSRKDISHTPTALRGRLVKWIHPFVSSSHEKQVADSGPDSGPLNIPAFRREPPSYIDGPQESTIDSWQHEPMIPDPSFAAINLTFALKEAEPPSMLLHAVSETRALAAVARQDGPTMEDFRVFQSYRTPLFADTLSQEAGKLMRGLEHHLEFRYLMTRRPDANHVYDTGSYVYVPGTFTGVWQGTYLTGIPAITPSASAHPTPGTDFGCRKPIQCSLSEYLCFSPNIPVPWDDGAEWTPRRLLEQEDGFNIPSRRYNYERFEKCEGRHDSREALDIFIVGETLEDHDQAWGGFLFAGRVQRDGFIVMKREPKDPGQDYLGTWVFEGRLIFNQGFMGRWRSSSSRDISNAHGIFSMAKISK